MNGRSWHCTIIENSEQRLNIVCLGFEGSVNVENIPVGGVVNVGSGGDLEYGENFHEDGAIPMPRLWACVIRRNWLSTWDWGKHYEFEH